MNLPLLLQLTEHPGWAEYLKVQREKLVNLYFDLADADAENVGYGNRIRKEIHDRLELLQLRGRLRAELTKEKGTYKQDTKRTVAEDIEQAISV